MKGPGVIQSPKRVCIYCRISETDDKVDKVARQEAQCREFCSRLGYVVVDVYCDDGISAYKDVERPEYERMKKAIAAGKYDVLVAVAEDRLSRNTMESLVLLQLCGANQVSWHTIHDGQKDPKDDMAQLVTVIGGWKSQTDVSGRVKKQKDAFSARRSQGMPLWGNRPFGFELDRITHRTDESTEIENAYQRVLAGESIYSIMKDWNVRGVVPASQADAPDQLARLIENLGDSKPSPEQQKRIDRLERLGERPGWTQAGFIQLLRRPSNAGLVSHSVRSEDGHRAKTGAVEVRTDVSGVWEPIVAAEIWQSVQDRLDTQAKGYANDHVGKWLLSGIARCGACGSVMRSASAGSRTGKVLIYRCATRGLPGTAGDGKRHPTVRMSDVHPRIAPAVADHFLFAPPSSDSDPARQSESENMRLLLRRLVEIRDEQVVINEVIGRPGVDTQAQLRKLEALEEERASVDGQRLDLAHRSAHAAMLAGAREDLLAAWKPRKRTRTDLDRLLGTAKDKRLDMDRLAELRSEFAARFGSLPLTQQRALVRSLLRVTVHNGRTSDRVEVVNVGLEPR